MYESFISDLNIFSNEFSSFIDTSDRPAILYKIQQKHIGELEDDLNIEDKKIDLYIWNAIFSKEIIRHGISKKYLHTLYNKYYEKIPTLNDLKALQELELENWKEIQEQQKIKRIQKETMKKYSDPNNEYYSQDKSYFNSEDSYKSYMERNILPYND